jgi:hypothetical protein
MTAAVEREVSNSYFFSFFFDEEYTPNTATALSPVWLVNVWLQSRSLPARGRVGLEVHRCLCIIDAGNVFISTVMG